jgi:hypothetical protein
MPKTPAEPIAHGQRVAGETRFEAAPDQVGRIRFTHPLDRPLPHDEHSFPSSEAGVPPEESEVIAAAELTPSPSVWEARGEEEAD